MQRHHAPAGTTYRLHGSLRRILVDIASDDLGTLLGEQQRRGPPHAATYPRDDTNLTLEPLAHAPYLKVESCQRRYAAH